MSAWITLIAASALTLALRAGPSLIGGGRAKLPTFVQHANRVAVPALMGALASRSVAAQASATDVMPVLAAVAAAVPVALRTRSMTAPIVAGVAVFMLAAALR
jgi:branched-subunit amino acid transport protein